MICSLDLARVKVQRMQFLLYDRFSKSYLANRRAFPFPLYTFTIQLLLQSTGTAPLLTTSLQISVTHFTAASPAAFNISAATPDGPAALPLFALDIAELT